jgi:DNA-directed RNA polymerase subunit RPC12/RpoP
MEESFTIRCTKCGHTQNANKSWLLDKIKNSTSLFETLTTIKSRLTCTACGSKNPEIIKIIAEQERRKLKIQGRRHHFREIQGRRHPFREIQRRKRLEIENQRRTYQVNQLRKKIVKKTDKPNRPLGWNKISCPVCDGDGGPGGNCFKCLGSG